MWLRLVAHLDGIHDSAALTGWLVTTTRREAWRVRAAAAGSSPPTRTCWTRCPTRRPGSEEQVIVADEQRALWAAIGRLLRAVPGTAADHRLRAAARTTRRWPPRSACPSGSIGPTRGRCLAKLRALLADEHEGRLANDASRTARPAAGGRAARRGRLRACSPSIRGCSRPADPMPADLPERIRFFARPAATSRSRWPG